MEAKNHFLGRTIAVIADLSLDEQVYLYEKTRLLKKAWQEKDKKQLDAFRIKDHDLGIYEVFLEDSTRTKESFRNAAEFHRVRNKLFDAQHSSFNKDESYADSFNMLLGFENNIFVVRSKLEGVCRWLEFSGKDYVRRNKLKFDPIFFNAGDGEHEHPTQELLDELTFLEDNNGDLSHIHLALVGDLYHGRTIHSKADGLKIFKDVEVDLIAPQELAMPKHYIDKMQANGFRIHAFNSVKEYLAQKHIANKWYFGRPQLERMGEDILRRQNELIEAIDFKKEDLGRLLEGTGFYHPLPRNKKHPIPGRFVDDKESLNRFETQSRNGMFIRIVLTGAVAGVEAIGHDFNGRPLEKAEYLDDFVEEAKPESKTKEYAEGVRPLKDGIAIDHVCRGETDKEIREHIPRITKVLGLYGRGGEWICESKKEPGLYKGIIFRPGYQEPDEEWIKKLAAVAPGCTLNIIRDGTVVRKLRLKMPPKIYNFEEASCKNPNCISFPQHYEGVHAEFLRKGNLFVCAYCEKPHSFKDIWN